MRTKLCVLFFSSALVPIGTYFVVIAGLASHTRVTRLACGFSVEGLSCPSVGECAEASAGGWRASAGGWCASSAQAINVC